MPWLSILMPTFNGARFLSATLASLREQDLTDVELLVVDDGSTDETLALIERFADHCAVSVLAGPQRKNWVASTNVALAAARGEFTCILHQDDGFLARRLEALRALTQRYAQARVWSHWAQFLDDQGRPLGLWRTPFAQRTEPVPSQLVLEQLLVQNFYAMPSPLFRTRDAQQVGGLDEQLWYAADWDFWLKLSRLGDTVCIPEPLAWFRVHNESQTVRRSQDPSEFRGQLLQVFERHAPHLNSDQKTRDAVRHASMMSSEVNVTLSSALHGNKLDFGRIWSVVTDLDANALRRFAQASRIHERLLARLRARVSVRS